jgi:hypothetical protein
VRIVHLTDAFYRTRALRAPRGSPEDRALRTALRRLGNEEHPLPGPHDREAFRTPIGPCWMRAITGTRLVVQYGFIAPVVYVFAISEPPPEAPGDP